MNFGFGSHDRNDEVFVGAYKIVEIYTVEPDKHRKALEAMGFAERKEMKTLWQTFTPESPGERMALEDARPTRDEMLEALKDRGLYYAERREE